MPQRKKRPSAPVAKRRRTGNVREFGASDAADDADDPPFLQPDQSSSQLTTILSTRVLQSSSIPSLASLAARLFVTHIRMLSENERSWANCKFYLKRLPDALVPKLFSMLRSSCPTLLSHGLITLYFLRGPSLTFSNDLPGVRSQTIASIAKNSALRELYLVGFSAISDVVFASILPALSQLRVLVLRGCSKVGKKTAEAIGRACLSLTTLNLNYTSVPPISLLGPLAHCTHLEVLKVAGIGNWIGGTFEKLLVGLRGMTLPHMKSLKFRQLDLCQGSMYAFIAQCPNLTHLDVSFTNIYSPPPPNVTLSALEKLSLTSTLLSSKDTVSFIGAASNLRTLYLGALGNGPGSSCTPNSAMKNGTLRSLTDIISRFDHLEKLSLVGNTWLGISSRYNLHDDELADAIRRVGRKCKYLNLSGLPRLRSDHLSGLADTDHDGPCKLEQLALNNTGIDDSVMLFLVHCPSLAVLEVAGTKLTSSGLFPIIDACPKLEKLDLTSCRGIRVADRRRFFEVWEKEKKKERRRD